MSRTALPDAESPATKHFLSGKANVLSRSSTSASKQDNKNGRDEERGGGGGGSLGHGGEEEIELRVAMEQANNDRIRRNAPSIARHDMMRAGSREDAPVKSGTMSAQSAQQQPKSPRGVDSRGRYEGRGAEGTGRESMRAGDVWVRRGETEGGGGITANKECGGGVEEDAKHSFAQRLLYFQKAGVARGAGEVAPIGNALWERTSSHISSTTSPHPSPRQAAHSRPRPSPHTQCLQDKIPARNATYSHGTAKGRPPEQSGSMLQRWSDNTPSTRGGALQEGQAFSAQMAPSRTAVTAVRNTPEPPGVLTRVLPATLTLPGDEHALGRPQLSLSVNGLQQAESVAKCLSHQHAMPLPSWMEATALVAQRAPTSYGQGADATHGRGTYISITPVVTLTPRHGSVGARIPGYVSMNTGAAPVKERHSVSRPPPSPRAGIRESVGKVCVKVNIGMLL